jgi:uncharacterized membrane protein YhaH (DUF805 family)
MDLGALLFSLQGRINRAKYWIGLIVVTLANVLSIMAVVAIFGVSSTSVVLTVLIALAMLYPTYALMAKRFQDRDKPGWTALLALGPVYAVNLIQTVGLVEIGQGMASKLCDLIVVGIALWLLIELGILKGTQGPNRFGPDPLGTAHADAVL